MKPGKLLIAPPNPPLATWAIFFSINQWSCMQGKLYTEFDLLFDFFNASVFGPGNMVFIFQFFFGWVTSLVLAHLVYISYPFSCNDINIYMLGWPNVPMHKNFRVYIHGVLELTYYFWHNFITNGVTQ